MELTTITPAPRARLSRRLRGGTPPSLRATLFLSASTFMCGCVLASLLFVGVWRHTAAEAAQSRASVAEVRESQQSTRHKLLVARAKLAALRATVARAQHLLVQAEGRTDEATTALAQARGATRAITRSLSPRLQAASEGAASLARDTATIESELNALVTYTHAPGAAGLDAGYLETQTRYLARAAAAATSAAAALAQETRGAQAAAHA